MTVLYGILGFEDFVPIGVESPFEYANEYGHNSVSAEDGTNTWVDDRSITSQHWLKLREGVSNESVSELLNVLLAKPGPPHGCCFEVCVDDEDFWVQNFDQSGTSIIDGLHT